MIDIVIFATLTLILGWKLFSILGKDNQESSGISSKGLMSKMFKSKSGSSVSGSSVLHSTGFATLVPAVINSTTQESSDVEENAEISRYSGYLFTKFPEIIKSLHQKGYIFDLRQFEDGVKEMFEVFCSTISGEDLAGIRHILSMSLFMQIHLRHSAPDFYGKNMVLFQFTKIEVCDISLVSAKLIMVKLAIETKQMHKNTVSQIVSVRDEITLQRDILNPLSLWLLVDFNGIK